MALPGVSTAAVRVIVGDCRTHGIDQLARLCLSPEAAAQEATLTCALQRVADGAAGDDAMLRAQAAAYLYLWKTKGVAHVISRIDAANAVPQDTVRELTSAVRRAKASRKGSRASTAAAVIALADAGDSGGMLEASRMLAMADGCTRDLGRSTEYLALSVLQGTEIGRGLMLMVHNGGEAAMMAFAERVANEVAAVE